MSIEGFIQRKKFTLPNEGGEDLDKVHKKEALIGREAVLKMFKKKRPANDNADEYLNKFGL